jgi:mono/diheme cytochrome c family protein/uncharacterized membrane protein
VVLAILALLLGVGVLGVLWWATPTESAAADLSALERMGGRLHPLVLHLPIGLLGGLALLELLSLAGMGRRFDPAMGALWWAAFGGVVATFGAGHLLGVEGNYNEEILAAHRSWGVAIVVGVGLCLVLWTAGRWSGRGMHRWIFRGVFGLTLGALTVGAHEGGKMSHGSRFLTEHLDGALYELGLAPAPVVEGQDGQEEDEIERLVYRHLVAPIFERHCNECHGVEKREGGYRSDSYANLLLEGDSGYAGVVPGDLEESEAYQRILLDGEHSDVMPPEGKGELREEELAILRWWIEAGAGEDMPVGVVDELPEDIREEVRAQLGV